MPYQNFGSQPTSTLSADERAQEARRILLRLADEDEDELDRRLTDRAKEFLSQQQLTMSLLPDGVGPTVTTAQLFWLRDIAEKFN